MGLYMAGEGSNLYPRRAGNLLIIGGHRKEILFDCRLLEGIDTVSPGEA